jgi:hypothetical protein
MAQAQKWGATAPSGYFRLGLAEFRAALPLADSPIAQPTNYAMPGMATPGEVTEARREESPQLDENSVVGSRINQIGPPRDDRGRDDRDNVPERE